MAKDFHHSPKQYNINLNALENENNEFLTGASILREEYNTIKYKKN